MINPAQTNLDPRRRGFQQNGAPTGYGQQNGYSPFLDRSQQDPNADPNQEQGRVLASAPGLNQPMGPLPPPPYMQALEGGNTGGGTPPPSPYAQALNQTAPQKSVAPPVSSITAAAPSAGRAQVAPVGAMSNMSGYDATNWADPDMDSVKYGHGRLANGIVRPSVMGKLVASEAYQKRFPGARFDGKDRVYFNGALSDGARGGTPVYSIDVLRGADRDNDTSEGGDWMPDDIAAAASGADVGPQDDDQRRRIAMALANQGQPSQGGSINIQDIIAQLVAEQQQAR